MEKEPRLQQGGQHRPKDPYNEAIRLNQHLRRFSFDPWGIIIILIIIILNIILIIFIIILHSPK